jgi:hypothetical protein
MELLVSCGCIIYLTKRKKIEVVESQTAVNWSDVLYLIYLVSPIFIYYGFL